MKTISSISIDFTQGHLYFAITNPTYEEGIIRLDYNAPLQAVPDLIVKSGPLLINPHSLAFHQDKLWWSESIENRSSIHTYDMITKKFNVIAKNLAGEVIITIMSNDLQPEDHANGCEVANSPCEELCLYVGRVRCQCSNRRISNDHQSCENHKAFIVFSRVSDIESLHIDEEQLKRPPFPIIHSEGIMKNAIGLAYSFKDKLI